MSGNYTRGTSQNLQLTLPTSQLADWKLRKWKCKLGSPDYQALPGLTPRKFPEVLEVSEVSWFRRFILGRRSIDLLHFFRTVLGMGGGSSEVSSESSS
jgi:hypothetical protein